MNQRATEYDLNNEQFEQLMDKYVMTIVDSMSTEDFRQFVINTYYDDFSNYNIRHAKVYEILTFSDNKFITVWALDRQ